MSIDFPDNPIDGQVFISEGGSFEYVAAKSVWRTFSAFDPADFVLKSEITDFVYPVGSIVSFSTAVDPNNLYPGTTWVAYAQGRTEVGVGSADGMSWAGGQLRGNVSHTLTESQMPTHNHSVNPPSASTSSDGNHDHGGSTGDAGNHNHQWYEYRSGGSSARISTTGSISGAARTYNSGGGEKFLKHGNQDESAYTNNPNYGNKGSGGDHDHNISNSGNHNHTVNIPDFNSGSKGNGAAHNNVQPSIGTYKWERTA